MVVDSEMWHMPYHACFTYNDYIIRTEHVGWTKIK